MGGKYEINKEEMFRKIMPSAAGAEEAVPAAEPQDEAPGGPMSQDAIAAMFAQQEAAPQAEAPQAEYAPEPQAAPAEPAGGPMSQDAIAAMFAQQEAAPQAEAAQPEYAPEPQAAPAEPAGGPMSQDAIAAMFAQQEAAPQAEAPQAEYAPEPQYAQEPQPAQEPDAQADIPRGNGFMSEDAIAAAFAVANGQAPPEPATATANGTMSEDAIAAMFAAQQEPAAEAPQEYAAEASVEYAPEPQDEPASQPEAVQPEYVEQAQEYAEAPPEYAPEPQAAAPEPAYDLPADDLLAPPEVQPVQEPEYEGVLPYPVNLMEFLVEKYYPIYREKLNCCTCQRCQDDVSGITLNKISPHYVTSEQLDEIELANRGMVSETVTALIKALFIVKRNPHHDDLPPMRQ